MNSTQSYITVSLGQKAHSIAGQFAASTTSPKKGKQIYLNTLTVYAVHCYLAWLRVESSLEQSDSWSIAMQNLSNAADLFLTGIGYLECRLVLPGETSITIPPQATEDRIGYVAVRLHESLEQAELLGFLEAIAASNRPQQIPLSVFEPIERLLTCLSTETQTNAPGKIVTNLSRWLENVFENEWLTVETLFGMQTANPALSVRNKHRLGIDSDDFTSAVRRGKTINFKVQLQEKRVALIVTCQRLLWAQSSALPVLEGDDEANIPQTTDPTITIGQPTEEEMEIRLQVYPIDSFVYLPPDLQLTVLDDVGATIPNLEARARSADNCIQLEFTGKAGEQFSVKIALEDVSITEDFQI